jgi:hypothetical protein
LEVDNCAGLPVRRVEKIPAWNAFSDALPRVPRLQELHQPTSVRGNLHILDLLQSHLHGMYHFLTIKSFQSLLPLRVPIFALIDPLRYKPFLVLEAVSLLATWLLLIYGTSLWHMQLMQICFGAILNTIPHHFFHFPCPGIASSADVAYYSYLYAVVSKKHYRRTTSYIRTASMLGKFLAYSLGQLLISTELGDYLLLNQALQPDSPMPNPSLH